MRPSARVRTCSVWAALAPAFCAGAGPVVFVNQALTTGANDGSSWANAYRGRLGLQAALTAAPPGSSTQIWVAAGTYAPAPAGGSRSVSFDLKSGVEIYGGFAGGESALAQRDASAHPAVLTGDLSGNDANGSNLTDNSLHVVTAIGVDATSVLDGVTVRAGNADSFTVANGLDGGGLLVMTGAPRIAGCAFTANNASTGGAVAVRAAASPTIENCSFTGNWTQLSAGDGIIIFDNSSAVVRACRFVDVNGNFNSDRGVGICVGPSVRSIPPGSCAITVEDCYFSIQVQQFLAADGVAIKIASGTADIRRCRFIRNSSVGSGGAVSCDGVATIDRCLFVGNEGEADGGAALYGSGGRLTVTNSLFAGNDRRGFGTVFMQQGTVTLVNCTLAYNGAPTGPHGLFMGPGIAARNCVVWGNRSGLGLNPVAVAANAPGLRFDRCCVQGGTAGFAGADNISSDPLFTDAPGKDGLTGTEDDDLRLAPTSPCIDRGDNSFVPPSAALDLDGLTRFADQPSVADLGAGLSPIVDLGAFERRCPSDFDGNGFVNGDDFDAFVWEFEWGTAAADFNRDGFTTGDDFDQFVIAFEAGC